MEKSWALVWSIDPNVQHMDLTQKQQESMIQMESTIPINDFKVWWNIKTDYKKWIINISVNISMIWYCTTQIYVEFIRHQT